jgi:hypothetical protein
MLAREHGYWVSEERAIAFPETRSFLAETRPPGEGVMTLYTWCLMLAGTLAFIFAEEFPAAHRTEARWIGGIVMAVATIVLFARSNRQTRRDSLSECLRGSPWQAWPCRIESVDPKEPASAQQRVYLLSPQREVRGTFEGEMPREVWRSMTDGYGLLWVCGDLRTPVALASPGGAPVWLASPVRSPAGAGDAAGQPSQLESLIQQAGFDAMSRWLEG